ncbi:class I SAM-dependent methyltransferase [Lysobacter arvi]|uniref:Class I SAM-dependent methyltransferase n=1 Tax=Lysobacter arvi TaxID=3038776 RepID=A0ABU1CFB3_9GAMM|nr:class I SAM-dependent methyltransferase [Lysobacter arvi]MDR0183633.1 class I SAM-dependent methyltransferase [Lysobacter arvi]
MARIEGNYDADYYQANGQDGDRPALKLFRRLARRYIAPGQVMDFGCGTGFFLPHLARHFRACGVESSEWARTVARRRTGLQVHSALSEVESASLSGIVSIHVVEHIPDGALAEVLGEWRRVLQPGGRALVITPDAGGFASRRKGAQWIALTDPTHINLKSHREWRELFIASGFDVVKEFADGLWDFPYIFGFLGKAEVGLLGWPTLAQFLLGRPLLSPGSGESSIFVLQRMEGAP